MKKEDIINIWSVYSSSADDITNKRLTLNGLFLTVETALFGFIFSNLESFGLILSFVNLFVIFAWNLLIISFRKLNVAKFKVIRELENQMGIKPYMKEWEILKRNRYIKLTTIEVFISVVLFMVTIVGILLSVSKK